MAVAAPAIIIDKQWKAVKPQMDVALASLREVFQSVAESVAPGAEYVARTKERASAAEKLERKPQYTEYAQLPDLVRGAILCADTAQVKDVCRFLYTVADVAKLEVKQGTDENPYRGVIHLDIRLNGLICEVQICTANTWKVKKQAHKLYKAGKAMAALPLWENVEAIVF